MDSYEYRMDILQAIEQRLQSMSDRYCRTYVVRLDILNHPLISTMQTTH